MKPTLNEQLARMQKLAGIIKENQVSEATGIDAVDYTVRILNKFKRSVPFDVPTILKKAESLKNYIENQYDTEEIGAEMAYTEIDDMIDAVNNGNDIMSVIDTAIANLNLSESKGAYKDSKVNFGKFKNVEYYKVNNELYLVVTNSDNFKEIENSMDFGDRDYLEDQEKSFLNDTVDKLANEMSNYLTSIGVENEIYDNQIGYGQEIDNLIVAINPNDLSKLNNTQTNEGYDEFKRADKGSKGVTAKNKGEEKVYGAGVEKGEKIEKKKMTKEKLKAQIKEMILAELNEDSVKDINITNDSSDYNFYESKIAEAEGDMQNLKFNWLIKDEDFYKYDEKGVADGLDVKDGKKVKEIVGYFEDEDGDEDFDVIAYISSDGDIVDDDDILYDFWYKELNKKLADLARKGMEGSYKENDDEYEAEDDSSADSLYKMFVKYDLDNDRRYYDVEDLMDAYPNLSKKEAKKLKDKLQNPLDEDEEDNNSKPLEIKDVDLGSIDVEGNIYDDGYISSAKFKDSDKELSLDQRIELEDLLGKDEIAKLTNLNEAKKDKEEVEDVTVDDTEVVAAPEADMMAGETAEVSGIQSNLQAAYAEAKVLGDEKLITQIANTITYFTKAHILDTAPVNENMFPMLKRILR